MRTQQAKKHASFRAISGTSGTFNGDAMAAMAVELTAAGRNVPATFNGRMIAWLKLRTGSSESNINALMNLFAQQEGAPNWSALGEFGPAAIIGDLSPIVWYKCDEGTGTTLNDSSGNENHGTFGAGSAAPVWLSAPTALAFDGGDIVNIPSISGVLGIDIVFRPAVNYSASENSGHLLGHIGTANAESGIAFGTYTGSVQNEIITLSQQSSDSAEYNDFRRSWTSATEGTGTAWQILQSDWLGASPYYNLVRNGVDVANATVQVGVPWEEGAWGLGREINGTGVNVAVAYVVMYGTARTAQQQAQCRVQIRAELAERGLMLP